MLHRVKNFIWRAVDSFLEQLRQACDSFIAGLKIVWVGALFLTTKLKTTFIILSYLFLWFSIVGIMVFTTNEAFLYFSAHNPENIGLQDFLNAVLPEADRLPQNEVPVIRREVVRRLDTTGREWCLILSLALLIKFLESWW